MQLSLSITIAIYIRNLIVKETAMSVFLFEWTGRWVRSLFSWLEKIDKEGDYNIWEMRHRTSWYPWCTTLWVFFVSGLLTSPDLWQTTQDAAWWNGPTTCPAFRYCRHMLPLLPPPFPPRPTAAVCMACLFSVCCSQRWIASKPREFVFWWVMPYSNLDSTLL